MELTEKLAQLDALQKKLYAFTCAESSLYLDSVTVAPKNTAEGRGVALSLRTLIQGMLKNFSLCTFHDAPTEAKLAQRTSLPNWELPSLRALTVR